MYEYTGDFKYTFRTLLKNSMLLNHNLLIISYIDSRQHSFVCVYNGHKAKSRKVSVVGDGSVFNKLAEVLKADSTKNINIENPILRRIIGHLHNNIYIITFLISMRKKKDNLLPTDLALLKDFLEEAKRRARSLMFLFVFNKNRWGLCIIVGLHRKYVIDVLSRILSIAHNLNCFDIRFLPVIKLKEVVAQAIKKYRLPVMLHKDAIVFEDLLEFLISNSNKGTYLGLVGNRDADNIFEKEIRSSISNRSEVRNVVHCPTNNPRGVFLDMRKFLSVLIFKDIVRFRDELYGVEISFPMEFIRLIDRIWFGNSMLEKIKEHGKNFVRSDS